jgi:hypothetical protein
VINASNLIIARNLSDDLVESSTKFEQLTKEATGQLSSLEPTGDYLSQIERRLDYLAQLMPLDDVFNLDSKPLYLDWKRKSSRNPCELTSRPFRGLEVSLAQSRFITRAETTPIEIIYLHDRIASYLPMLTEASCGSYRESLLEITQDRIAKLAEIHELAWPLFRQQVKEDTHDRATLLKLLKKRIPDNFYINLFAHDPYETSEHLQEAPEGSWGYVPTSSQCVLNLLDYLPADPNRVCADLGSGKGSFLFPGALCLPNYFVGFDNNKELIERGEQMKEHAQIKRVRFFYQSVLDADLSQIDDFFVYSPFEDEKLIEQLSNKINIEAQDRDIRVIAGYAPLEHALDSMPSLTRIAKVAGRSIFASIGF